MDITINDTFIPNDWEQSKSLIKVIGVGGGGCNAVTEMFHQKIHDVEFAICNTDKQSLAISDVPEKIHIGAKGLGAGCNPENGRKAATESIEKIKKSLGTKSEMIFITAGMGGGTGTGAAPVIAKAAKDAGKLTVGVVTIPFRDEGAEFIKRAAMGINELKKYVDSLLIIDNQKLYDVFGNLNIYEAFPKADEVLSNAVKSISDIITREGFINVDFADVKMIMQNSGMAIMGTGTANGPDRATKAVEMAFESPLLNDFDLNTAKGVLVNITSSKEQGPTMAELSQIMEYVNNFTGNAIKRKRGIVIDPTMGDSISVTIVATGFSVNSLPNIDIDNDDNDVILDTDDEVSDMYGQGYGRRYANDNHGRNSSESVKEEQTPYRKSYAKPDGKPVLILEPGDNILELESQPAYLRRNVKLQELGATRQERTEVQQGGEMKIDEINGIHHLSSNNSYLHQTQD